MFVEERLTMSRALLLWMVFPCLLGQIHICAGPGSLKSGAAQRTRCVISILLIFSFALRITCPLLVVCYCTFFSRQGRGLEKDWAHICCWFAVCIFSFIKAAFTWRMKCTSRLTVGWREKSELLPFEVFLPIQSQCRVVVWGPKRPKIKLLSAGSAAF